jgi:hypothetical protein
VVPKATLRKNEAFERLCQQMREILAGAGVTKEDLLASLPEARNRVNARYYGPKLFKGAKIIKSRPRRKR